MASLLDQQVPGRDDVVTEALSWPDRARRVQILDALSYTGACELLKGIKALRQKIADTFDPHVKRAYESHRALVKEKADAEAPLTEAERVLKNAIRAFDDEQERRRREEQRRLEEAARREEETRRLEQAAAMEREAREFGDAGLEREAHALIEEPIAPPPVAAVAKATPRVSGITYRTTYSARVTDLRALIQYVARHPEHANLLTANTVALNGLARSLKDGLKIPGVQVDVTRDVAAGTR